MFHCRGMVVVTGLTALFSGACNAGQTEDKTTYKVVVNHANNTRSGPPTARMRPVGATPTRRATNPNAWSILRASGRTCGRLACERNGGSKRPRQRRVTVQQPESNATKAGTLIEVERTTLTGEKLTVDPLADGPLGKTQTASESGWPSPPTHPDLVGDEIHVWCAGLDELASDLPAFSMPLSDSERKRADRFQFDRDRNRFIVRHGLLRMILGRYLNTDPERLAFACETRGKPIVYAPAVTPSLHFNLSHSNGLVLIAGTRQAALGVDVERLRFVPEADQIAARFFSPHEGAVLNAMPAEKKWKRFSIAGRAKRRI